MEKQIFFSFLAYDFQIALQSATQDFMFKFEFSEYRFERVKGIDPAKNGQIRNFIFFLQKKRVFICWLINSQNIIGLAQL